MASDSELAQVVGDDFVLDDLENAPGFIVPPNGAYHVKVDPAGIQDKEINDADYYAVNLELVAVVEMAGKLDDGEEHPKPGDIMSLLFNRKNLFGMSNFKKFATPIAQKFSLKTIGPVKEASKGIDMLIITKRKFNKKNEQWNMNVEKATVL